MVIFIVLFCLVISLNADPLIIPVYQDGIVDHVVPSDPVWNFRSSVRLGYDSYQSRSYRGWLKFDLDFLPTDREMFGVEICFILSLRKHEYLDIYDIANIDQVSEEASVWNNQPTMGALLVENVSLNPQQQVGDNWLVSFSSTAMDNSIKAAIDNSQHYWGCVLKEIISGYSGYAFLSTRESLDVQAPYMKIYFCDDNEYDINTDCEIDLFDLMLLAENWLGCGYSQEVLCQF